MEKLILWDFDETLILTKEKVFETFLEITHREKTLESLNQFNNLSNDDYIFFSEQSVSSKKVYESNPVKNSQKVVQALNDSEYIQKCLTARPERHSNLVEILLDTYFHGLISDIYYGNLDLTESKILIAKKLRAYSLIDDNIHSFRGIKNSNIIGINYDPQNKNKKIYAQYGVKHIKDLRAIPFYL